MIHLISPKLWGVHKYLLSIDSCEDLGNECYRPWGYRLYSLSKWLSLPVVKLLFILKSHSPARPCAECFHI